jgi:hypothetical protein
METACKVLIVGGLMNLAYGFLTGVFLSAVRLRSPQASRYLVLAHVGPLMQGPTLLGLALAVPLSAFLAPFETMAAWLLVGSSAVLGVKDTLNWLQGVRDEFAERPAGFYLGGVAALLGTGGLAILIAGVLQGV